MVVAMDLPIFKKDKAHVQFKKKKGTIFNFLQCKKLHERTLVSWTGHADFLKVNFHINVHLFELVYLVELTKLYFSRCPHHGKLCQFTSPS